MDALADEINFAQEPQKTVSLNSAARSRIQRAIQGQLREMDIEESAWWLLDLLKEEDFLVAQGGSTQDARLASLLEGWWKKESAEIQKNCKWMQKHRLPVAFLSELSLRERFAWLRSKGSLPLSGQVCHLLVFYPIRKYSLALCLVVPRQSRLSETGLEDTIRALSRKYLQWEKEAAKPSSLERLQKFITSRGSLARLTNDFRKPLANLMLSQENIALVFDELGEGATREEAFRHAMRRFGDQLQILEGYTNDLYYLLTGEQAEAPEAQTFVLKDLVEDICRQLQEHYAGHKTVQIHWNVRFSENSFLPKGHVFRILYNLLENAYKFSASAGIIHISIENRGNWIRIDIEDNGNGFYLRDEDFELSRLNLGRSAGSAGIGLAASYELARRLGGRLLRRRPNFGEGAHFLLVLPNYL